MSSNAAQEAFDQANELALGQQYAEAAEQYDRAIAANPSVATYYFQRAQNTLQLDPSKKAGMSFFLRSETLSLNLILMISFGGK